MNQYVQAKQENFTKAIEFFKKDILSLRTGRANPSMLDNVYVDAYGAKVLINTLANINVSDKASIIIAPWDKSILKDIEHGIVAAELGISVVNEGDKIRLSMPPLTEENRKDLVKKLGIKMESARIELRKVRDEIKTDIERAFEAKEMSEDDKFRFVKELDEETSKFNSEVKEIKEVKEKDILTI
jgi:ribosome recycling factor